MRTNPHRVGDLVTAWPIPADVKDLQRVVEAQGQQIRVQFRNGALSRWYDWTLFRSATEEEIYAYALHELGR